MRSVLGLCGVLLLVAAVGSSPASAEPVAKKPRLSIPVPKSGDFSVGIVTVKAKAKPGKPAPKNLKVKLKLANHPRASQVTVVGSVRKKNRSTFKVVVGVVNKRTSKKAARSLSSGSVHEVTIDVVATSPNVTLQMSEMLPGTRSSLDNILTRPDSEQAGWDPVWKGAQADVEAGVAVYLDKGLTEQGIPKEFLLLIVGIALEISEDGDPNKDQALEIFGEVDELYIQIGDFGCRVTVRRNPFVRQVVDIFIQECQPPIVEVAIILPEMVPGLGYGPVKMFTPQGQVAGDLTPGCEPLYNAVIGIRCPVPNFQLTWDIAGALVNVPDGTQLGVMVCQNSERCMLHNQGTPA